MKKKYKSLCINHLASGGLITNYYCSSKCRHCVYASSPSWPKDYITAETADSIFKKLRGLSCNSVHIGGGEPLLNPEKLYKILECAQSNNIYIDYIETNSSWYKDESMTVEILRELQKRNINTLLISIDPYHNEYIPFYKVKGLFSACKYVNMNVFPWLMDFWNDLDSLDDKTTHNPEEYRKLFGENYEIDLARRYNPNINGRALKTYRKYMEEIPLDAILDRSTPCNVLSGIHHFHIDLYGSYIPQSCPGFSIKLSDLGRPLDSRYKILNTLYSDGIKGLYNLAVKHYNYKPEAYYVNCCDLCLGIRKYLVLDYKLDSDELKPAGFYLYI